MRWLTGSLCLVLSACGHGPQAGAVTVNAETLHTSAQCADYREKPGITRLRDAQALERAMVQPGLLTQAPAPSVDFTRESVLLLEMGSQPTPGYGMELRRAEFEQGALEVHVRWVAPSADAILPQMLTSPCIVVKVPRTDIDTVRVIDQHGAVRVETTLR